MPRSRLSGGFIHTLRVVNKFDICLDVSPSCLDVILIEVCLVDRALEMFAQALLRRPVRKSLRNAGSDARLQGFRTPAWPELVDNQGYSHPREEPSRQAQQSLHSM